MRNLIIATLLAIAGAGAAFIAVKYKNKIVAWYTQCCENKKTSKEHQGKALEMKIKTIEAEELKEELAQGDTEVINVLPAEYFTDCSIKDSKSIPLDTLEEITKSWPRDKKIVVYCAKSACHASKDAAIKLANLGFTSVRAYEGGMKEWLKKFPSQVSGTCAMPYLHE